MATSTSWTLWKRLPPRYQLSVRSFVDEDDQIRHSPPGSPKGQRRGSARLSRNEIRSPGPQVVSPTPGKKHSIQNIPTFHEKETSPERPRSPSGSFFPYRKSGYIDHFKTQQRVNSARVMMATDDGCNSRSPSPTGRFSKTPSNSESKSVQDGSRLSARTRGTEIQHSITRCEHHHKNQMSNSPPDGDNKKEEVYLNQQYSNKMEQRKYLVRETDEGTMYIDRGKIIYFRKYRSSPVSQTSNMSRYNDGGYLASIRREYLTKPRLLAMGPRRKTEHNETQIHYERENYNRKAGHILDYYNYPDEDNISVDDLTRYTTALRKAESPKKQVNMTTRNVKRIYFAYPKLEHEVRPLQVQDLQTDPGAYFKVNQQLKLHERNFYLKTPGHKSSFREADLLDCACGMCRIEMQLALMAQAEVDSHDKFVQGKTFKSKLPINNAKLLDDKKSLQENELKLDLSKIEKTDEKDPASSTFQSKVTKDASTECTDIEENKQEQVLTVTIPKMETNREISEVAKENEVETGKSQTVE